MPTLVVFGDAADGVHFKTSTTYATARETQGAVQSANNFDFVGQDFATPNYTCRELFFRFDTTTLGDLVTPTSVLLELFAGTDSSVTDFTVEARYYDWGSSLEDADFVAGSALGSKTLVASLATASLSTGYRAFTSDAAFIANVSGVAFTDLILNSDRHRLGTTPTGAEQVEWTMANFAGTTQDPKLTVTYADNRRAFIAGDRAKETTTSTGTGNVTLAGAASGFIAFSSIPGILSGDVVAYAIVGATEWEVGIGSWRTGSILNRDRVLTSSNAGALVNFSAGTKDVFNTLPAAHGTLPVISRLQAADTFVPRDTTTYSPDDYEIGAGFGLEMGPTAGMEIG